MHIQVTIISRLKAATFEAKGRGKAAQRESGGREESGEGNREFFLFLNLLQSMANISPRAKQPESTRRRKKPTPAEMRNGSCTKLSLQSSSY